MRQDDDASFFLELERAAKRLTFGGDRRSASDLRSLLERLQAGMDEASDADVVDREPADP